MHWCKLHCKVLFDYILVIWYPVFVYIVHHHDFCVPTAPPYIYTVDLLYLCLIAAQQLPCYRIYSNSVQHSVVEELNVTACNQEQHESLVLVWDYIRLRRRADGKGKPVTNEYWQSMEHIPPSGTLRIRHHFNLSRGNGREHKILGACIGTGLHSSTQ